MRTRSERTRSASLTVAAPRLGAIALSLALAACSAGPSEGDIRQAVDKASADAAKQMASIPGMLAMKVEVLSVKKLGCQASGSTLRVGCRVAHPDAVGWRTDGGQKPALGLSE